MISQDGLKGKSGNPGGEHTSNSRLFSYRLVGDSLTTIGQFTIPPLDFSLAGKRERLT